MHKILVVDDNTDTQAILGMHFRARGFSVVYAEDATAAVRTARSEHPNLAEEEPGHLGLASMRERAELSGGWWKVDSAAGRGTAVEFFVPDSEPAKVPVGAG